MPLATALTWLADRLAREKFVITRTWSQVPYLSRWTLLGKRFGGSHAVYLHRFHRSDADEMHDHPWPFVSLILTGGYHEKTPAAGWADGHGPTKRRWYGPGRILARPANWIHSVEVDPAGPPVMTLIFRGPKQKSWGFFCSNKGFVPWRVHVENSERTGSGCGD